MLWLLGLTTFVIGMAAGSGITVLVYERNSMKAFHRKLEPSISTLDVFEMPPSMRPPSDSPKRGA